MKLQWQIESLKWRVYRFFFDNYKYIQRYKKTKDLDDLEKYIRKSKGIEIDIDEVVAWNRCYGFEIDGNYYHSHTLKELLLDILELYRSGETEFKFYEENFHEDELKIVYRFLEVLKGEREVS